MRVGQASLVSLGGSANASLDFLLGAKLLAEEFSPPWGSIVLMLTELSGRSTLALVLPLAT